MLAVVGLFLTSLALLFVIEPFWLQMVNAVFLACCYLQFSFLLHDSGHREIYKQPRNNDIVMLGIGFFVGVSRSWWFDTHNRHHAHPNDLDLDPNTQLPVLAFSEEQALSKTGFLRFAVRYQAFYFLPLLCLEGIGVRVSSITHVLAGRAKYPLIEGLAVVTHIALVGVLVFWAMPFWHAMAFIALSQLFAGFYLGIIFAPNHKGTLIPTADDGLNFFQHQLYSSRNARPSLVLDNMVGALNYQIEHHLYPTIPRNKLGKARRIVQAYCAERGLAYNEKGFIAGYVEVLSYFHRMSKPLRSRSAREAFEARRALSAGAASAAVSTLGRASARDLASSEG